MRELLIILGLALVMPVQTWALEPEEKLEDPALEARARALSMELRCPTCQSQNIDESNAVLARDLRAALRYRLLANDTDEQAINHITASYGDYVRLRPPWQRNTYLLWLTPFIILLFSIVCLLVVYRRQPTLPPLSAAERFQLQQLLKSMERKSTLD
jgi:cytochrome c-type biogenesis protein CcmH